MNIIAFGQNRINIFFQIFIISMRVDPQDTFGFFMMPYSYRSWYASRVSIKIVRYLSAHYLHCRLFISDGECKCNHTAFLSLLFPSLISFSSDLHQFPHEFWDCFYFLSETRRPTERRGGGKLIERRIWKYFGKGRGRSNKGRWKGKGQGWKGSSWKGQGWKRAGSCLHPGYGIHRQDC